MRIVNLRANHMEEPLGHSLEPLSLSWVVEDGTGGFEKSRIRLCTEEGNLVYDTGFCENLDSRDTCLPVSLCARTRYRWTVYVKDQEGNCTQAESFFETGKMTEEWQAHWITSPYSGDVHPVMEKMFTMNAPVVKARLYLCGLGLYEAYVDGKKVGDEYLSPGFSSYDIALQADTWDVTALIGVGFHTLQVFLGNGWYKGRIGFDGGRKEIYGDGYYILAELHLEFEDGTVKVLCTDDSWQCRPSPILESGIYDGEVYDAGMEESGETCQVLLKVPPKCPPVSDRYRIPVCAVETLHPVSFFCSPKGEMILDFGQNISGWVQFYNKMPAGCQIGMEAFEMLQDGCCYQGNLRTAKQRFVFKSGGKAGWVRPHFTYFGFRYVKVTTAYAVEKNDFEAVVLSSRMERTGYMETNHQGVNRLIENIRWSQIDNFLDIPTDCPQRDERLGWTGDAQIFSGTACFNQYVPAFYAKYMRDLSGEQKLLGGAVPNIVPRIKHGIMGDSGISAWADAATIIPWKLYVFYGSKTLLANHYPCMKAWVDFVYQRESRNGNPYCISKGFQFGDWLALDHDGNDPKGATDPFFLATVYYWHSCSLTAKAARVLEYATECEYYEELAGKIWDELMHGYYDGNGICRMNTQTALAVSLFYGLTPPGVRRQEAARLAEYILENGTHLNTGFIGTPVLLPALSENGFHELAVELLLQEDIPGWLYEVNMGATTVWERWNSLLPDGRVNPEGMNSLNHYSYGCIQEWMYTHLAGIRLSEAEPGFRHVVYAPAPDKRLGRMQVSLKTVSGNFLFAWQYRSDGNLYFDVEVPYGAGVTAILPSKTVYVGGSAAMERVRPKQNVECFVLGYGDFHGRFILE